MLIKLAQLKMAKTEKKVYQTISKNKKVIAFRQIKQYVHQLF